VTGSVTRVALPALPSEPRLPLGGWSVRSAGFVGGYQPRAPLGHIPHLPCFDSLINVDCGYFRASRAGLSSYDCDHVARTAYLIYPVALGRKICWPESRWLAPFHTQWFLTVLRADPFDVRGFPEPDDGFQVSDSAPPTTGVIFDLIKIWLFL